MVLAYKTVLKIYCISLFEYLVVEKATEDVIEGSQIRLKAESRVRLGVESSFTLSISLLIREKAQKAALSRVKKAIKA